MTGRKQQCRSSFRLELQRVIPNVSSRLGFVLLEGHVCLEKNDLFRVMTILCLARGGNNIIIIIIFVVILLCPIPRTNFNAYVKSIKSETDKFLRDYCSL
jgi:hypothetical protein